MDDYDDYDYYSDEAEYNGYETYDYEDGYTQEEEADYGDAEAEYGNAEADYGDAEAEYGNAEAEYGNAEAEYGDAEAEYGDAEAEYGDAGAEYGDAEAEYGDAEAEYGDAEAEYGDAEAEYGDAEAEYYAEDEEGSSEGVDDAAEHLDYPSDYQAENSEGEEYSDVEPENVEGNGELFHDEEEGAVGSEQEGHSGDAAEYFEDAETDYSDVEEGDNSEDEEYNDYDDVYYGDNEYVPVSFRASSSMASVPAAKPSNSETFKLLPLSPRDADYSYVSEKMHKSIVTHSTMQFTKYKIIKIEKVWNTKVYSRFKQWVQHIREETDHEPNVTMLFHGSPKSCEIVKRGFDERHASRDGMFGAGVYFAEHSSKSNQYAFGLNAGCGPHGQVDCQHCTRLMMLCRVVLGSVYTSTSAQSFAHAPPGHHSVEGSTLAGNLRYPEYIVYRGEQFCQPSAHKKLIAMLNAPRHRLKASGERSSTLSDNLIDFTTSLEDSDPNEKNPVDIAVSLEVGGGADYDVTGNAQNGEEERNTSDDLEIREQGGEDVLQSMEDLNVDDSEDEDKSSLTVLDGGLGSAEENGTELEYSSDNLNTVNMVKNTFNNDEIDVAAAQQERRGRFNKFIKESYRDKPKRLPTIYGEKLPVLFQNATNAAADTNHLQNLEASKLQQNKKPLHLATSILELNEKAKSGILNFNKAKPEMVSRITANLVCSADKSLAAGDEELAYVDYMKYIHTCLAAKEFNMTVDTSKLKYCLSSTEKLTGSLKSRYALHQLTELAAKAVAPPQYIQPPGTRSLPCSRVAPPNQFHCNPTVTSALPANPHTQPSWYMPGQHPVVGMPYPPYYMPGLLTPFHPYPYPMPPATIQNTSASVAKLMPTQTPQKASATLVKPVQEPTKNETSTVIIAKSAASKQPGTSQKTMRTSPLEHPTPGAVSKTVTVTKSAASKQQGAAQKTMRTPLLEHHIPGVRGGPWIPGRNGEHSSKAVIGGRNLVDVIYVARILHQGSIIPGKLIPEYKNCFASVNGSQIKSREYEVFCDENFDWLKIQRGLDPIPDNAIIGGIDVATKDYIYIGRVQHGSSITCGKVQADKEGSYRCYVMYGNAEHAFDEFEILVQTNSSQAPEAKEVPSVSRWSRNKNMNEMPNSKLSITAGVGRFAKSYMKLNEAKTIEDEFKLTLLQPSDKDYSYVSEKMQKSIMKHGSIQFSTYKILKIEKVWNTKVYSRFIRNLECLKEENDGVSNEKRLFHGSKNCMEIVKRGFDERHSSTSGMFGAGVYFADHSSKSNQYVFGMNKGCTPHGSLGCPQCTRMMMLCRVALGKVHECTSSQKFAHAPPGHHSVKGSTSAGNLKYPEYIVYRGEQAFPEYLITYQILQ